MTDPVTGHLVYGRAVGHKEFIEHSRLTRMKQRLNDTTLTSIGTDDASFQMYRHSQNSSQNLTTTTEFEREFGTIPVEGSARPEGTNLLPPALSTL